MTAPDLSQPDGDRLCHGRYPLVGPSLLRPARSRGETGMTAKPVKRVRCAVYTRVSTEYGLDQEFNSLDAQHEAASAYILSRDRGPLAGRELCQPAREICRAVECAPNGGQF